MDRPLIIKQVLSQHVCVYVFEGVVCHTVKMRVEVGISQESNWAAARAANDESHNSCWVATELYPQLYLVSKEQERGGFKVNILLSALSTGATQSEAMIRGRNLR